MKIEIITDCYLEIKGRKQTIFNLHPSSTIFFLKKKHEVIQEFKRTVLHSAPLWRCY